MSGTENPTSPLPDNGVSENDRSQSAGSVLFTKQFSQGRGSGATVPSASDVLIILVCQAGYYCCIVEIADGECHAWNAAAVVATAAQVTRNFGFWQDRAVSGPIAITHHGRLRLMLISIEDYESLQGCSAAVTSETSAPQYDLTLLDHLPLIFVAADSTLAVRFVNLAAISYFRRSREELQGRLLTEFSTIAEQMNAKQTLNRVMRLGEPICFEAPSPIVPGSRLRIDAFPHGDGLALFIRVIDEEVEAVRALDKLRALRESMAIHGGAGLATLGMRGAFVAADAGFTALSGFREDQLIGVRIGDIAPVAHRARLSAALEAVFGGKGAQVLDSAIVSASGEEIALRLVLAETRDGFAVDGALLLATRR